MPPPTSPEPLRPREICAVLYAQWQARKYHWAICIPHSSTTVKKFHVKESSTGNFSYEEPPPDENLSVSPAVSVVVKLGECTPKHTVDYIHSLLRAIPMQTPKEDVAKEPRFSSRVWWKEAVRTLHRHGVIHCPDVHELERELFQFAELNDVSQSSRGYKFFVSRRSV
ncbi:hypothetical protein PsYK624_022400 [Phanerochaete sordida]|uniref:Uncharacterized protein n=1 Tax=Phanerochaete sordida TaxID=48140 RepID=A0A9P3G1W4_9APHY|nr:hypothetical protein PsYK624_022400 [Phanerochaete sordida]